jgi:hypothetical protein
MARRRLPAIVGAALDGEISMRRLVLDVVRRHQQTIEATLGKAARDPRLAMQIVELGARLNRELGPQTAGNQLVAIEIVTRLPMADMMRGDGQPDASQQALGPAPPEDGQHAPR